MAIKKLCLTCVGVVLLAGAIGCAKPVNKIWSATGGSRADATVELSYEYYPETEQPILNEMEADNLALKRCESWGYHSAEAFGGVKTASYTEQGAWGYTTRKVVTKTYQCIGKGDEEVKKSSSPRDGKAKLL